MVINVEGLLKGVRSRAVLARNPFEEGRAGRQSAGQPSRGDITDERGLWLPIDQDVCLLRLVSAESCKESARELLLGKRVVTPGFESRTRGDRL